MATDPTRTYPSELPVLALRQTVVFPLTLQPLAINRPMSIEAVNRALAGDRLLFLALQNTDKRRAGARRPADASARSPRSGRWPRCPTAASTSSSKGLVRAKAELITQTGASLRATVVAAAGDGRDDRSRSTPTSAACTS